MALLVYSGIFLLLAMVMWSFEISKYSDNGKNMSLLLFFKFSKWFFIILAFAAPIAL